MRNRRSSKFNILLFILVLGLAMYIMCQRYQYEYEQKTVIKFTRAEQVWNYMADFSNMLYLNPTIIKFKILSEEGNIHDWHYSVEYTENMSHWPYLENTAIGNFTVSKPMHVNKTQDITYTIHSNHVTCFLFGHYCLYTKCLYDFKEVDNNTIFTETINYECPPFVGKMCEREVAYQRNAIHYNLSRKFHENQSSDPK